VSIEEREESNECVQAIAQEAGNYKVNSITKLAKKQAISCSVRTTNQVL
jgi:hypothetical protein